MTIGPEPMTRIRFMSLRRGIEGDLESDKTSGCGLQSGSSRLSSRRRLSAAGANSQEPTVSHNKKKGARTGLPLFPQSRRRSDRCGLAPRRARDLSRVQAAGADLDLLDLAIELDAR